MYMNISPDQSKPDIDETLDTIYKGKVKIFQKKNGYRFSIDAVLLADYVLQLKGDRIIDIGTGSAVVPLMIAKKNPHCMIVGIEIQDSLFDLAIKNVRENGFQDRINIVKRDIKDIKSVFPHESFDIVTANPPYIRIDSGRINPLKEKAIARHEILLSLKELVKKIKYLLTPTGKAVIIYPANRAIDLVEELRRQNIEPKAMQVIYSKMDSEGKLVIVEASKSSKKGGLKILPPCVIYNEDGTYTDEVEKMLEGK